MKTIKSFIVLISSIALSTSMNAQDDVYYNPRGNTNVYTPPSQPVYQNDFEQPASSGSNSNASDYDYRRDGYESNENDYTMANRNNSESTSRNSFDSDDDFFFDDFGYSSRLRRYYMPVTGVSFWDPFYDPFYWNTWNRPTVVINTGWVNPWWSDWRTDICFRQPWRCNATTWYDPWYRGGWGNAWGGFGCNTFSTWGFGGGWGGGWNNGWGGGWNNGWGGGWNNGWGGGWNNGWGGGWNNGWGGGWNNGWGGGWNNGWAGGWNNGWGGNGFREPNYSYSGNRMRTGSSGSNTTDGQIRTAGGRTGKTDETEIPREGIVRPIPGRGNVTSTPSNTNPSGTVAEPGRANPERFTPANPSQPVAPGRNADQIQPRGNQPAVQPERPVRTVPQRDMNFETRPAPSRDFNQPTTQPDRGQQFESRPTNPRNIESRPQPQMESRPQPQMESRPNPRSYESRPQPQMESRPNPRSYESRPQPQMESRPNPRSYESRPQPQMESRPSPRSYESRPQPQMESRPAPRSNESRPQMESRPAPRNYESRPQPQMESRPAPRSYESRPAPQMESRPAPSFGGGNNGGGSFGGSAPSRGGGGNFGGRPR
jgi:hypothetical protein